MNLSKIDSHEEFLSEEIYCNTIAVFIGRKSGKARKSLSSGKFDDESRAFARS